MYISANKVNITHSYTPARIDITQHSWAGRGGRDWTAAGESQNQLFLATNGRPTN